MTSKTNSSLDTHSKDRNYRVDLKHCIVSSCDGELTELAYYERNNWVTVELQCDHCKRKFALKIEM